MGIAELDLPVKSLVAAGRQGFRNWKSLYEQFLQEAEANQDNTTGDGFLFALADPTTAEMLQAVVLAFVHLHREKTMRRAVEYCTTVRLVTHQFFSIWDRTGCLPDDFTDFIARTIKEGNADLAQVSPSTDAERDKLTIYQGSCALRLSQYQVLREFGREAVHTLLVDRAKEVIKAVSP